MRERWADGSPWAPRVCLAQTCVHTQQSTVMMPQPTPTPYFRRVQHQTRFRLAPRHQTAPDYCHDWRIVSRESRYCSHFTRRLQNSTRSPQSWTTAATELILRVLSWWQPHLSGLCFDPSHTWAPSLLDEMLDWYPINQSLPTLAQFLEIVHFFRQKLWIPNPISLSGSTLEDIFSHRNPACCSLHERHTTVSTMRLFACGSSVAWPSLRLPGQTSDVQLFRGPRTSRRYQGVQVNVLIFFSLYAAYGLGLIEISWPSFSHLVHLFLYDDISDWPTIPQVYIEGEFMGGCDTMMEMHKSGELERLVVEKKLADSPPTTSWSYPYSKAQTWKKILALKDVHVRPLSVV